MGIAIFAACAFVIMLLAGAAAYLGGQQVEVDGSTLCPLDAPDSRHVVIVVDATDSITPTQADYVGRLVGSVSDSLTTNERLTVIMLDEDSDASLDPLLSLCKPEQGKRANNLYRNPRLIQQRFEERFGGPLRQAIERLRVADEAPRSPLIQTLAAIAEWREFLRYPEKKIVFVSDLLQNTPPAFSHYSTRRTAGATLGTLTSLNLSGVEVELIPIARGPHRDLQRKLLGEWKRLLTDAGARIVNQEVGWVS